MGGVVAEGAAFNVAERAVKRDTRSEAGAGFKPDDPVAGSVGGGAVTPGFVCGNGVCEPPLETAKSCAADCAAPPAKPCKSIKDCKGGEVCCNKGGALRCLAATACGT